MKHFFCALLVVVMLFGVSQAQEKLTLEESIKIALEQSPTVLKARAEIEAAEGVEGQARAGFLPQISLNAGIGKYYSKPVALQTNIGLFEAGIDEQADMTSCSASLTQAIFTAGKLSSSLGMASKGLEIAREELKRITQEVKFNVISAYYGILKAKKFVELSGQSVEMARGHLGRINALMAVGMSTRADLLRGEVQLANAEVGLTKAKQALEIAKNHFNNSLGRDLSASVELTEIEYETEEIPVYDYDGLLKIAYETRPDWRQYILSKRISEDEVGLAYSGLWPMLSLVGNYDVGSTKYPSYQSDTETWTALLSASWNIFDGTATWNKIKESKAKLEANKASESDVKKAIALEVKDANFALRSAKENLAGTQKALDLAEENFKIADLRYKSGVGTNLEVIDAQVAVTQARIEYLQAQHDLQIAKSRINKVIGREIY